MSVLPKEVNFSISQLPPNVRGESFVAVPQNGSSFSDGGQQIQLSLVQNSGAYFIPGSGYLTFNIYVTGDGSTVNHLLGIPACSVFSRSDLFINSQNVESISNYGALVNTLFHGKMNIAQKSGLSYPFGTTITSGDDTDPAKVDSRTIAASATVNKISCSVPLCNLLQNASDGKMIPLDMGEFRLLLTLDQLANFACESDGTATSLTAFSITDVEYHYDCVVFDAQTDALIKGSQVDSAGDLYIKTESYQTSQSVIAQGQQGSLEVPFANSLTSIKSLITNFTRSDRYKQFASYDITGAAGGSVSYTIAGIPYPPRPLDTLNHRSSVVIETIGALHGNKANASHTNCSYSANNFRDVNVGQGDDSVRDLSKATFGVSTEKLDGSYLLTGVSSMNSNSTVRLNIGTATPVACNVLMIFNHDCLLKYNPSTNQVVVMK
jgi:hypothetical protein